ncbi:amidohydrolase family protein [Streptomyces sp. NPDC003691]
MRTLIHDVRLFDGRRTAERATVLVDGDTITAVDTGPAGPAGCSGCSGCAADPAPPGRPAAGPIAAGTVGSVVDGAGRTLLPGLVDAHTHTFDGSLAEALRHGVTTELDMFCLPANLARQRRLAAERDDVADLRSAGTLATAPGGHPLRVMRDVAHLLPRPEDATEPFETLTGPAGAAAFVAARAAAGSDYLKIVIDDGEPAPGAAHPVPTLGLPTARALVRAARGAGLLTIAHIASAADAATALDAGVDGLGHVWSDTAPDDPATVRLIRRAAGHGVFVITTLAYTEVIHAADPRRAARAAGIAGALHRAGVPLLAGTDATPFAPRHGEGLHRELELLTAAGLTPAAALTACTAAPARRFGLTDRGRIAPGLRADLLLVDGDPTRSVTAIRAVREVWRRGVPLYGSEGCPPAGPGTRPGR